MPFKNEKSPLIRESGFDNINQESGDEDEYDDYATEKLQKISKPRYKLMIYDVALVILEFLQYFALIQALSLRWTWPQSWIQSFSFLFLFNLDIWDFVKVTSNAFVPARDYITPSSDVPVNFKAWILTCLIVICLFFIVYYVLKKYLIHREMTKAIPAGNFVQRIMITLMQVFALPIGVNFGKIFWCNTETGTLDVSNDIQCWNVEHCIYIVIVVILFACFYLVYAVWLYRTIYAQIISHNNKQHEAHIQLKDCEAMFKLDTTWNYRMFFIFASFRRRWVYARPIFHIVKFVIIAMYAGLYEYRLEQISVITVIYFIFTPLSLLPRLFRVTSFNLLACLCWFCLSGFSVIGILMNMNNLRSVFITETYVIGELILFSVIWIVGTVLLLGYFILRSTGVFCKNTEMWPNMISKKSSKIPENMQRYMHAAVQARLVMQRATELPPLLAPVHDLSHQIHVINALACEAEYTKDPLESSLRSVLDDLIVLHTRLVGQSLFSESLQPTSKSTVMELVKVMPDLTKRLNQREFDFILISPVRRRLLFKLFVVSCFLRRSVRKDTVPMKPNTRDFWKRTATGRIGRSDDKEDKKIVIEEYETTNDEGFDEVENFNEYSDESV